MADDESAIDASDTNGAGSIQDASITTRDGTFYVVRRDDGHELYADEVAAIDAFGDHVDGVDDIDDEDQVREIEIGEAGDDWIIRRLTWQDVARRLLDVR